ncbi:MAG: heme-binding protein [Halopseudomonas sabulinigri]|tara:strand:- start:73507 stop:73953 length:447 start_codon:yes stop_codon:yes gene_type:complete
MTANALKEFVQPSFTLTESATLSLLNVAVDKADELGIKATVAVVDQSGRLLAFVRMAGSFLISSELAQKKAFTAAGMGVESVKLESILKTAEPRVLEGLTQAGEFTVIGGGVPVFWGGVLIGGVGVSGGSEEQDIKCAQAAAAHLSCP